MLLPTVRTRLLLTAMAVTALQSTLHHMYTTSIIGVTIADSLSRMRWLLLLLLTLYFILFVVHTVHINKQSAPPSLFCRYQGCRRARHIF
jgi:uncharacterized membrane protein